MKHFVTMNKDTRISLKKKANSAFVSINTGEKDTNARNCFCGCLLKRPAETRRCKRLNEKFKD